MLAGCEDRNPDQVRAAGYDSFWLWAGVKPPAELRRAKSIYLLDGERLTRGGGRYEPRLADVPHLPSSDTWLVVRTDTMDWPADALEDLVARADSWAEAGNRMTGIQVDFDARTRHLDRYAAFLAGVRERLPDTTSCPSPD